MTKYHLTTSRSWQRVVTLCLTLCSVLATWAWPDEGKIYYVKSHATGLVMSNCDNGARDARILQEPDDRLPFVGVDNLGDSSVNLVVRVWVKTEDYWTVYHEVQPHIYELFTREGINIPYPQQVVHLANNAQPAS